MVSVGNAIFITKTTFASLNNPDSFILPKNRMGAMHISDEHLRASIQHLVPHLGLFFHMIKNIWKMVSVSNAKNYQLKNTHKKIGIGS